MAEPAYTRLEVDERRRQLLDAGAKLFAEHAYDQISMRSIAKEAGISKALLYHYFPSKGAFFSAALKEAATELERLTAADPALGPFDQLRASLDAYLGWIENNAGTWSKVVRSTATLDEAADIVEGFRARTLERIVEGITGGGAAPPALRVALHGWLGFLDGACLDWVEHRDISREQVLELTITAFGSALLSAAQADPSIKLELG